MLDDSHMNAETAAKSTQKPISGRPSYIGRYGGLTVPGTRAGAIVSGGLVVLAWVAIPLARPFILGTVGLGLVVGLLLWLKHRSS
jgi:hypothetical protein